MDEAMVRAIVAEEMRRALTTLMETARRTEQRYAYAEGRDIENCVLTELAEVVETTIQEMGK